MAEVEVIQDASLGSVQCCVHCKQTVDKPLRLRCLHSCCKECLVHLVQPETKGELKGWNCELCGTFTKQDDVKENHLLESIIFMENTRSKILVNFCESCQKNCEHVLQFCTDCRITLCLDCIEIHRRIPLLRQHNIEQVIINELFYCQQHDTQLLEAYCDTCEELVCTLCTTDHEKHNLETSNKGLDELVEQVDALIPELRPKLKLVQIQQEFINNTIEKIKVEYENWRGKTREQLDNLVKKIKEIKTVVEQKVDEEEMRNIKKLRDIKIKIQQKEERIINIENLANLMKSRLKFRNQSQLMELESLLLEQAKELSKDVNWLENVQLTYPFMDGKAYKDIRDKLGKSLKHVKYNKIAKVIDSLGHITEETTLRASDYIPEDYLWHNFKMIKTTKDLNKWCNTLNVIDEFLYIGVSGNNVIEKYNRSGYCVQKYNNVHHTMAVKRMNNGDILAAGDKGLYITNLDFSQWHLLCRGCYTNMVVHGNKFTAIDFKPFTVVSYKYDISTHEWQMDFSFNLSTKSRDFEMKPCHITFCVHPNNYVIICNRNKLLLYTSKGEVVKRTQLIESHNKILGMDKKGNVILCGLRTGSLYSITIAAEKMQQRFICEKNKFTHDIAIDCDSNLWILHGDSQSTNLTKYKINGKFNKQAPLTLSKLEYIHSNFKRYMNQKFEVDIKNEVSSHWCNRVNKIDNFFYIGVSGGDIIKRYNTAGVCDNEYKDVHKTIVVKRMTNEDIIAGGDEGLFVTNRDFSQWILLLEGCYAEITVHENKFTALEYKKFKVVTFAFDKIKRKWQLELLFEITAQHITYWNSIQDKTRNHETKQTTDKNGLNNSEKKDCKNDSQQDSKNDTAKDGKNFSMKDNEKDDKNASGKETEKEEVFGSCQLRTKHRIDRDMAHHNATMIIDKDNTIILCHNNTLLFYTSEGEPLKQIIKLLDSPYRLIGLDKIGNVILCNFWSGKVYSIENIKEFDVDKMEEYMVCEKHLHTRDIKLDKEGNLWILHGNETYEDKYYLSKYGPKRYISIYVENDTERKKET